MTTKVLQPLLRSSGPTCDLLVKVATRNVSDLSSAARAVQPQIILPNKRQITSSPSPQQLQIIKPSGTQIITRNLTLRYAAGPSGQRSMSDKNENVFSMDTDNEKNTDRPLAILMAWLMAGEKPLEKYRQLYLRRGYDVLTVRTSPLEFVFPERGAHKIADNVIQFLSRAAESYPKMLIHAFSVGAYQLGEVLVKLKSGKVPTADLINDRIKGLVFDSAVDLANAPPAVARAVLPKSKIGQKSFELSLKAYLRMAENMATRHYRAAQAAIYENPLHKPSLIVVSHKDKFATLEANDKLAADFSAAGIPVDYKVFDDSPHVEHYRYYPVEYEQLLERFLTSVKLNH